jgi:hypothetical protein
MIKQPEPRVRYNIILFALNFIYIFVIGLFHDRADMNFVYYTVISLIYFISIFTVQTTSNRTYFVPLIIVAMTWLAEVLDMPLLAHITGYIATIFFFVVIVLLIIRISKSKTVGALEFLESINVYLLLGIAASLLFTVVYTFNHEAYNPPGQLLTDQSDFIYYAFVTMTTLGYGDITPIDSMARSLSIFFSVMGQLYLALIVAMLVGKYLGQKQEESIKKAE